MSETTVLVLSGVIGLVGGIMFGVLVDSMLIQTSASLVALTLAMVLLVLAER